jgi:glycosyltransferase involved in cell wall biosynthesis
MRTLVVLDERWNSALTDLGLKVASVLRGEVAVAAIPGFPAYERAEELQLHRLPISDPRKGLPIKAFFTLKKALENFRPQVVITIRGDEMLFAALLKKRFNYKLYRIHGQAKGVRVSFLNKWLHENFLDGVILTSRKFLNEVVYGLRRLIVPGMVDAEKFNFSLDRRERWRAHFGVSPTEPLIGMVARFDPVKGHGLLFKALARLKSRKWKLAVVGREENVSLSQLRSQVKALGLEGRVFFIAKKLEDLPGFMSACDLAVAPSLGSEVVVRAPLEFMACQTCVVATEVGALPEVVSPPFGRVVPPKEKELALAINSFLKRGVPTLRKLGRFAREVTVERYSVKALTPVINDFFSYELRNP